MITPQHSDIWGGGAIVTFAAAVFAHIHDINEVLQSIAFIITITLGIISMLARLRKNREEKRQ